jgi:hypothetical protein
MALTKTKGVRIVDDGSGYRRDEMGATWFYFPCVCDTALAKKAVGK